VIFAMTITDGLTNLANRKQLDATLADELLRAQRHNRDLAVLMLDIDHFKRINDTYGHGVGDAVLRHFAGLLQKRMRPTDKLGRYGGEEFCAILPETNLEQALSLAEELRERTAAQPFNVEQRQVPVTVSIGASSFAVGMKASDLYSHADRMLYKAKHEGRNCVRG
jgi:diguanylate cyclase (GGDEF)-like protein